MAPSFKKFFLNEAIRLNDAKKLKLRRKRSGAYNAQGRLNELFKGKDRLIFDIDLETDDFIDPNKNPLIGTIRDILLKQGVKIYTKKDYIKGIAYKETDKDKKQPLKIGRLLYKLNTAEGNKLGDAFRDDPLRLSKNQESFKVVISRHPYDVAGMSTDRNWTSCMNLGLKGVHYKDRTEGINKGYVPKDIKAGSIVAYLASSNDVHSNGKMALQRPLARILLKPHDGVDRPNELAYSMGKVYGSSNSMFSNFVRMWITNYLNVDTEDRVFKMRGGLYSDGDEPVNFKNFKAENLGKIAFGNVFYQSRTDEKYLPYFEINTTPSYYDDGLNIEIVMSFDIPSRIPLETFRYDGSDSHPQFIDNIKRDIIKYSLREHDLEAFQAHGGDFQTFKVEYSFRIDASAVTDEKGNDYDADTIIETIENEIEFRIKTLDYVKCRKAILLELEKFYKNKDSQIATEKDNIVSSLNTALTLPFVNNMIQDIKKRVDYMNQDVLPIIKEKASLGFDQAYDYVMTNDTVKKALLSNGSYIKEEFRKLCSYVGTALRSHGRIEYHYLSHREEYNRLIKELFESLHLDVYDGYLNEIHKILFREVRSQVSSNPKNFDSNTWQEKHDFLETFHEKRLNYSHNLL